MRRIHCKILDSRDKFAHIVNVFSDIEDSDQFDTDLEDEAQTSQEEDAPEVKKAPNELFLEVN